MNRPTERHAQCRVARAYWLGTRPYRETHAWMEQLATRRTGGAIPDTLLLLEHEPVITLGRSAKAGNVLTPEHFLIDMGVDLVTTGRGGDVTYHGPGQLIAYAIFDLKPDRCDVRRYVADLCEVMVRTVAAFGISAGAFSDKIGAWMDRENPQSFDPLAAVSPAKLGAIGVRISRWVTMHGFALNVTTHMDGFQLIVPCGIVGYPVTSVELASGRAPSVKDVAAIAFAHFRDIFSLRVDGGLEDIEDAPLEIAGE